jgi:hypothetical protein
MWMLKADLQDLMETKSSGLNQPITLNHAYKLW